MVIVRVLEARPAEIEFVFIRFIPFRGATEPTEARSIRVCEEQRPFNHSCAAGGRIVSLELKICSSALPKQRATFL